MNSRPVIALFDDEADNIKLYQRQLKDHFRVIGSQNPFTFEELLSDDLAAVIIDVFMPSMDGLELYQQLRQHPKYNGCPLIFMSGCGSQEIMLNAYRLGAQDYLTRGMRTDEIVTRIKNRISFHQDNKKIFQLGSVKIVTDEFKAFFRHEPVELTLTELKLLKFLISTYPNHTSREETNEIIWPGANVQNATLDTHLSNLRQKFRDWEFNIQLVRSKGLGLSPKYVPELSPAL